MSLNTEDKIFDLHTHSNYSDGQLSPNELIKHAIKKNISVLSITDHDTIEGIKKVNKDLLIENDLKFINGIELSAKTKTGRMHILGYGIDINSKVLNQKMTELKDNSINAVLSIIEQIKRDYNIRFTYDDIKKLVNARHNLGRPDVARLCVKYGYANSVDEAFKKYLIPAHEKIRGIGKGLPYEECIDLILKSNGIPVLAHPKTLELNEKELLELLKEMIKMGLKGIEVYHSTHLNEEINRYLKIANKYDLLISGGSDYHGKIVKPDIKIGTGRGNLKIKSLSLVDHILK